jgi:hypothetical protein
LEPLPLAGSVAENAAEAVLFLATNTAAITGQIMHVRMMG